MLEVTAYSYRDEPVTHQTIPDWYLENVVIACGKRGVAPFSVIRPESKPPVAVAPVESPTEPAPPVFNGDFRYDGQVPHIVWGRAIEKHWIPGWKGSHPLKVTADGKLRLRPGQSLTHNPMVVPPAAAVLSLELELRAARKETEHDGEVQISFRPLAGDAKKGEGAVEDAKPRMLSAIPLAAIRGGRQCIPLPDGVAGAAGTLQIGVTGDGKGHELSVVIDDVRFDAASQ